MTERGSLQRLRSPHRWSGWPGAWCLDCGAEDISELCIAPAAGHEGHATVETDSEGEPVRFLGVCENDSCPEPGTKRHDPYARADEQPHA